MKMRGSGIKGVLILNTDSNRTNQILKDLFITILLSLTAVVVNLFLDEYNLQEVNIILIYLLCSVLTARYTDGYAYGIISSFLAVLTFDFFFVQPRFSFSVYSPVYFITFIIMFFITMYLSGLTSRAKRENEAALRREQTANALYELTSDLSTASSREEILARSLYFISETTGTTCCYVKAERKHEPAACIAVKTSAGIELRTITDISILTQGISEQNERYHRGNLFDEWKVENHGHLYGFLRLPKAAISDMDSNEKSLISAAASSMAIVLNHFETLQTQEKDRQEAVQERFRSNLLRSISHDLRTPLTGIMGTSELIMNMTEKNSELHILAGNIHHESTWLRDLVQNILSLTRLQGGKLHIRKELQIVEEVVDAAIQSMKLRYPARNFIFYPPDDVIAAKMDSKLFQQVMINLMDNANKHTPPGKDIRIEITENKEDQTVSVAVIDNGCGLTESQLDQVFTLFYTTHDKDMESSRGFGLGLPICDSIAKAHGGTLTAGNNPDAQGAVFTITIPEN